MIGQVKMEFRLVYKPVGTDHNYTQKFETYEDACEFARKKNDEGAVIRRLYVYECRNFDLTIPGITDRWSLQSYKGDVDGC